MDKEQQAANTVNGYLFGSAGDVELANQELNAAKYIEKKIADKNVNTVLSIYRAALEKKMFRTPVGYSYMHELRNRMIRGGIKPEDIDPIPLYQVFGNLEDDKPRRVVTVKKKREPYEKKNAILTMVNIILVILVIVMFIISMSGNRPTVLNYRRALENEYSSWKEELNEREQTIRERERELNITYTEQDSISE